MYRPIVVAHKVELRIAIGVPNLLKENMSCLISINGIDFIFQTLTILNFKLSTGKYMVTIAYIKFEINSG